MAYTKQHRLEERSMPNRSLMTDDIRGAKPRTLFK